jgi:FkbM family methyltransferase
MPFKEDTFSALATEDDILGCFRLLLGRWPNRSEWPGHSQRIGQCLENVVATFLQSVEFADRGLLREPKSQSGQWVDCGGFGLYVDPDDMAVGRPISLAHDYEPHVSGAFQQHVGTGMNVLDIGANIGYYSMLAASLVGPGGHVWSVEPNPANVLMLMASVKGNAYQDRVTVIQAAAYDCWEPLLLFRDASNGSVSRIADLVDTSHESVMGIPIDAALPDERIDAIKIDVEGAEGRAFFGMGNTLRRNRPAIFSEFTPGAMPRMSEMKPEDYLKMLTEIGYAISVLSPSGPDRINCGPNIGAVMAAYQESGMAHIDLLCEPVSGQ